MNAEVIGEISRIARRKCITRLHQCLAEQGIAVYPTGENSNQPRGSVYLLRFIPEETLFELQPGFPKYFQLARRYDFLSHQDADLLVCRLAALGASLRARYHGRLTKHLQTGIIGEFLNSASDTETLSLLEATEDWFPDLLHEQLPWPCVVDAYLMASEFVDLRWDASGITALGENPFRALIAGLGMVRVGHWLGLSTNEINTTLELLDAGASRPSSGANLEAKSYAERIMIPIFSLGFQATIVGVFSNLEQRHKPQLRAALHEAGHCLGEQYALERKLQLQVLLARSEVRAETLAEVAVRIASPVEHIVVSHAGEHHAYLICKEKDYLAGYEQTTGSAAEKLTHDPSNEIFDLHALSPPAQVHFKTLRGYAALDPVIHALRVKTALSNFFSAPPIASVPEPPTPPSDGIDALHASELDRVIIALNHQMGTPHGRRIAAKHLCFFEIVKAEFQAREARLSNAEMQKRMRSKLDTSKVNGYQVAGDAMKKFALDINAILPNCFLFEHLNDRVIQVRWR